MPLWKRLLIQPDKNTRKVASNMLGFLERCQKQLKEDMNMSKCKYCGLTTNAGGSCSKSPSGGHVVYIPNKCIYCGLQTNAGGSCGKSPHKSHVVDAGAKKCIYCALTTNAGGFCGKSPSKGHVLGGGIM